MKNGGFKGGNLSPFCKRKGHQNSVLWTVCYACLGKLHRLHDGDFGKIPFWKNTKFTTAENQILGKLQKWESLLPKL